MKRKLTYHAREHSETLNWPVAGLAAARIGNPVRKTSNPTPQAPLWQRLLDLCRRQPTRRK